MGSRSRDAAHPERIAQQAMSKMLARKVFSLGSLESAYIATAKKKGVR